MSKTIDDRLLDEIFREIMKIGRQDIALQLLQQGADINSYTIKDFDLLRENKGPFTPTEKMIFELASQLPYIKDPVEGYFCNTAVPLKAYSALNYAAHNGKFENVLFLLKHKADVNGLTGEGLSPIELAVMQNKNEVVKLLYTSGATFDNSNGLELEICTIVGALPSYESLGHAEMMGSLGQDSHSAAAAGSDFTD